MSEALNYLLQVRPEAMKSYFGFLKAAGRHLDPKTRAIISVITKVDNQTEAGFRQYLPRALAAGASADEILDALLTAFPTLGLTKIVWAIDILLDMDLPGFQADNLVTQPSWHDVAGLDEIMDGQAAFFKAGVRGLIVYRSGNEFSVYDNRCPHQGTRIGAEALSGNQLVCPRHHWRFDIRTGECNDKGDKPLNRFEYKVENNRLWVFC